MCCFYLLVANEDAVKNDNELQVWAKMLAASVEEGGAGVKVDISIKYF